MEKDGFIFAASHLIPKLMDDFERQYLSRYTPCENMNDDELIEGLAICHVEFIIIHPFREGNGRLGRLLSIIMAVQAGRPPLDFAYLVENKEDYIKAIHAGHASNHEPMKYVFEQDEREERLIYSAIGLPVSTAVDEATLVILYDLPDCFR